MRKLRHPLSGAIYEIDGDGLVLVTAKDGTVGRFTSQGVWVDGALRQCDPHVCVWVGGPQLKSRHEEAKDAREATMTRLAGATQTAPLAANGNAAKEQRT